MTPKQAENYERMRRCLRRLASGYQRPSEIRRHSERDFGLGYTEALEMAYENMQQEAKNAVRGVRQLKP